MQSDSVCRICGRQAGVSHVKVREMMMGTGRVFDYVHCESCGSLQIADVPPDILEYYPPDSYYSLKTGAGALLSLKDLVLGKISYTAKGPVYSSFGYRFILDRAVISVKKSGLERGSKILDVGSGNGTLLRELRWAGFSHLLGIDPLVSFETRSPVTVRRMRLEDVKSGSLDLIIFNHSLEHVPDPLQALVKARQLLAPHGIVLIRTPVVSFAFRLFGAKWYQLDAPRHLCIPSYKGMGTLLTRAGLHMDGFYYDSDENQFIWSLRYASGITQNEVHEGIIRMLMSKWLSRRRYRLIQHAHTLNSHSCGDQATFFASDMASDDR